MTTNGNQQLKDAPTDVQRPPEPKPDSYSVEFLLETPEGFHIAFRGDGLLGADVMAWMQRTSKGLAERGFKPVRRDMAVDVDVAAPVSVAAAAGGGSGEAIEIPGEGNKPPRCSLHGPMKWVEGTNKNTGAHYEFWGCSVRGCRPKKQAAA